MALTVVVFSFVGARTVAAAELTDVNLALKIWAAPEGARYNPNSPFTPAAKYVGLGNEVGRGEIDVRLQHRGLTAEVATRSTANSDAAPHTVGVANELFYETEVSGQHFTVGKKVMSWDVGFGFRPLDVVQQENRRSLRPFSLEGVPLVAWEWLDSDSAVTVVFANPVDLRVVVPRDDESVAARYYRRLGSVDLHLVTRYSERTRLQAGAAVAAVLGDAVEVHGSFRYQRRDERFVDALADNAASSGQPLATSDPTSLSVIHDTVAALVGLTVTPGWDLSLLGEAWLDPSAGTPRQWRNLETLTARQKALLDDPNLPRAAVLGNMAWGMRAFDRPNLLRKNLLLHISWNWERFEPAADFLVTPDDGGWMATSTLAYQGEVVRLDAGVRWVGGPPHSAYHLFPESATYHAGMQVFF